MTSFLLPSSASAIAWIDFVDILLFHKTSVSSAHRVTFNPSHRWSNPFSFFLFSYWAELKKNSPISCKSLFRKSSSCNVFERDINALLAGFIITFLLIKETSLVFEYNVRGPILPIDKRITKNPCLNVLHPQAIVYSRLDIILERNYSVLDRLSTAPQVAQTVNILPIVDNVKMVMIEVHGKTGPKRRQECLHFLRSDFTELLAWTR